MTLQELMVDNHNKFLEMKEIITRNEDIQDLNNIVNDIMLSTTLEIESKNNKIEELESKLDIIMLALAEFDNLKTETNDIETINDEIIEEISNDETLQEETINNENVEMIDEQGGIENESNN